MYKRQGVYGLENSYESTLAGVNGRTITLRNAYGNAIADENATTYAAKDGSNLVLLSLIHISLRRSGVTADRGSQPGPRPE